MMGLTKFTGAVIGMLALTASSFATNVTVADGSTNPGIGFGSEDQETEPAAAFHQKWDLEAFVSTGTSLAIVGGFPMTTFNGGFSAFKLGDLFIDTDNDFVGPPLSRNAPIYGDGFLRNSDFRFEYVIRFTRTTISGVSTITGFQVVQLTSGSRLSPILYADGLYPTLDDSNPYQYKDENGGAVNVVGGGTISYVTGLSDAAVATALGPDVIVTGGTHNILTLNFTLGLNPLMLATDLHLTMGCGNDNLLGHIQGGGQDAPDGGRTLVLLGLGLASLAFLGRKVAKV